MELSTIGWIIVSMVMAYYITNLIFEIPWIKNKRKYSDVLCIVYEDGTTMTAPSKYSVADLQGADKKDLEEYLGLCLKELKKVDPRIKAVKINEGQADD